MNSEKELQDKIESLLNSSGVKTGSIREILKEICKFTGWPYGEAWKLDDDKTSMRFFTAWYINADYERYKNFSSICKFSPGVGLVGEAWAAAAPVKMDNLAEHFNFLRGDVADRSGFISGFGFPVRNENQITGIFDFFTVRKQHTDDIVRNIISSMISKLSIKL